MAKGTSSFPLSPCNRVKLDQETSSLNIVNKGDQLHLINNLLGKLDSKDTSFIVKREIVNYHQEYNK